MYQACGEWQESVKTAENYDRINLKNTYYRTAKLLELSRDFQKAIEFYEKSGTYAKEIPRMLLLANEIELLKEYIQKKKEPQLLVWWAQYLESTGDVEESLSFYLEGKDYASCVRLLII